MLTEKYRPQTLDQVVGHREVVESLRNMLTQNNLPHAIMFSGQNGVGKTTLARIIANELDAEIIEIDGATFGKIEVMRDMQDSIPLVSMFNNRKVYIIDECQGLSKQAFDSLLKTIENPPGHVYFIFCTTELEKVIRGVVQRSIHYNLKPVSSDEIKAFIEFIVNEEKMNISNDVLDLISIESKGSPRQALVYLTQVNGLDIDDVRLLLNTAEGKPEVIMLCRNIVRKEGFMKAMEILNGLKNDNLYGIRLQILNYLSSCVFNSKTEKDATKFLYMLSVFENTKTDHVSSFITSIAEIYKLF